MNKRITISVAIAAYNAEKNITRLVSDVIKQKETFFIIEKVIVNSDFSSDATLSVVKKIKYPKLKVISSIKRNGYAKVVLNLMNANKSDFLIILNDDIVINDNNFFVKLLAPFCEEKKVGMICANGQPITASGFVEKAVYIGYLPYKKIGQAVNEGNTILTIDAKVTAFSKKFIQTIDKNINPAQMGNVDGYLYFLCKSKGFLYRYKKEAVYLFRCPTTADDFIKWQTRNFQNRGILRPIFGEIVDKEFNIPPFQYTLYRLEQLIKHPFESIYIYYLGKICEHRAKKRKNKFNPLWGTVSTTKKIPV